MRRKNILKPPRQNDELLKAMFESNFSEFLNFIYPFQEKKFDFTKEIEFLNKELLEINPNRARGSGKRVVDILAKVRTKEDKGSSIIVHAEIQNSVHKDLSFRLFQYHYRLIDRYQSPVETIAFFIGNKHQQKPTSYRVKNLKTRLHFHYPSYHIFEHSETELFKMDTIFGLIILACQKSLYESKMTDEALGKERLLLAKEVILRNYPHDKTLKFLIFLTNILYIDDQEINNTFNKQLFQWTGGSINMDVFEVIKKQEREKGKQEGMVEGRQEGIAEGRQEGIAEGRQEGIAEGKLKSMLVVATEMKKEGISMEKIAKYTQLPLSDIEDLN